MWAQQLVNGLTLGSTYALIALGYTMVYGIIQLINFAHGEIYMAGAFLGFTLVYFGHVPFIPALLLAMAGAALLGLLVEYAAYRPLRDSSRIAALISAIGMSIFLKNLAAVIAGPAERGFAAPFKVQVITFGAVQFNTLQLLILAVSLVLMVFLDLFIRKTRLGMAMRATAQNREAARLMGINIDRVISATFAIGSALGAAAGVMIGIYFGSVSPNMGFMPGLKGFIAAVLGGIGSVRGAVLGGLILGMADVFAAARLSSFKDAVAFAILIAILLFKPTGLLGSSVQEKV